MQGGFIWRLLCLEAQWARVWCSCSQWGLCVCGGSCSQWGFVCVWWWVAAITLYLYLYPLLVQAMKPLPVAGKWWSWRWEKIQSGSLSRRESKTFGTSKMKLALPILLSLWCLSVCSREGERDSWLESCRGEYGSYHLFSICVCVVVGSCYNPLSLPLPVAGTSDEASTRCWEVMKLKMREDPKCHFFLIFYVKPTAVMPRFSQKTFILPKQHYIMGQKGQ